MSCFIGVLMGGFVGLVAGFGGWLLFFYIVFMLPKGIPFRVIDQGAIPGLFTGILGAIIGGTLGGILGGRYLRRWGKSDPDDP